MLDTRVTSEGVGGELEHSVRVVVLVVPLYHLLDYVVLLAFQLEGEITWQVVAKLEIVNNGGAQSKQSNVSLEQLRHLELLQVLVIHLFQQVNGMQGVEQRDDFGVEVLHLVWEHEFVHDQVEHHRIDDHDEHSVCRVQVLGFVVEMRDHLFPVERRFVGERLAQVLGLEGGGEGEVVHFRLREESFQCQQACGVLVHALLVRTL